MEQMWPMGCSLPTPASKAHQPHNKMLRKSGVLMAKELHLAGFIPGKKMVVNLLCKLVLFQLLKRLIKTDTYWLLQVYCIGQAV